MQLLANDSRYVSATIETEAISLAAGAWLAGKRCAVFCQNSGLGNLINPLSSLNNPFSIPSLLVLGWRGAPGVEDEPQHLLMGKTTREMLALMEVESLILPTDREAMYRCVIEAANIMDKTGRPVALLVRPNSFSPHEKKSDFRQKKSANTQKTDIFEQKTHSTPPARFETLKSMLPILPENAAVVATTGKCGRELFTLSDRPQHFYMVGSMGSASAIGLGIAINQRDRPVVVLDGDGAALMRLGTMATIGAEAPRNLVHIILDNGTHDSTGGQPTGSQNVDFVQIAGSVGYRTAHRCDTLSGLQSALKEALKGQGPHLIHMAIRPGSIDDLGRPTLSPADVAKRFRQFLTT